MLLPIGKIALAVATDITTDVITRHIRQRSREFSARKRQEARHARPD